MSKLRDMYRGETAWDFLSASRRVIVVSAALVAICVISYFARGLSLGIEFEGGAVWEVPAVDGLAEDDVRAVVENNGAPDPRVQRISGGEDIFRARAEVDDPAVRDRIAAALADRASIDADEVSTRSVSPSFGDAVAGKARRALIVFFVLIALYLTVRFEWKMALGALVAVAHDIILSVGVYSLFGIEVTPATVVAFLTIMGYSLYDTIVVFERIKENTRALGTKTRVTYSNLANVSLNQVLMRSVNTSFTSVLPVVSMLFVGSVLMGATALQEFGIALLIGILVGSYSSLFVATPIVVALKEREDTWREHRRQAEAAGTHESLAAASSAIAAEQYTRSQPPRPRKLGKKR